MSTVIYGQRERLIGWAAEHIGIRAFKSDAQAIGLERGGDLIAVAVFDTFSTTDCMIHIASDGSGHWLTRAFLAHVFSFPFIQCGYLRVMSPIDESNQRALRFNRHLGFEQEGRHPFAAKDGGAVLTMGLLRDHCRFIPKSAQHMRKN